VLIEGEVTALSHALSIGFAVSAATGPLLFWSLATDQSPAKWPALHAGSNALLAWIPAHFLNEGDYHIELIVALHSTQWFSQPGPTHRA